MVASETLQVELVSLSVTVDTAGWGGSNSLPGQEPSPPLPWELSLPERRFVSFIVGAALVSGCSCRGCNVRKDSKAGSGLSHETGMDMGGKPDE